MPKDNFSEECGCEERLDQGRISCFRFGCDDTGGAGSRNDCLPLDADTCDNSKEQLLTYFPPDILSTVQAHLSAQPPWRWDAAL